MSRFDREIAKVSAESDYVHCDVMDGHFVPNLTFGAPVVKWIKRVSPLPLDVHLMIENPGRWIGDYRDAGLSGDDLLTFHVEAASDPAGVIAAIREAGIRPGISLSPQTPVETIADFIAEVDLVLVMTVNPGFGGRGFIKECLTKVSWTAEHTGDDKLIGVDGGVNPRTAPLAAEAGANLLIAGNAVFSKEDAAAAVREIRRAAETSFRGADIS